MPGAHPHPELDADRAVIEADVESRKIKPYRSEAERIGVKQRKVQITLTAFNVALTCLILLRSFGIL